MASKTLLATLLATALLLAGCATARKEPARPQSATQAVSLPKAQTAPEHLVPRRKPQKVPGTASPSRKPQLVSLEKSRAELPAMIGSGASWSVPGQQMTIRREGAASSPPVPLFRQAGTLASVRAALATSPAQPQAEFRNGVLTLKFNRGSNEEIASAVNKTLSVTGSRNLQVTLQP